MTASSKTTCHPKPVPAKIYANNLAKKAHNKAQIINNRV